MNNWASVEISDGIYVRVVRVGVRILRKLHWLKSYNYRYTIDYVVCMYRLYHGKVWYMRLCNPRVCGFPRGEAEWENRQTSGLPRRIYHTFPWFNRLIERAKRAHSLVMTFEIFHICVFMYLRTSNIQCACVASSAIFENKLNGKQAQRVAGIELELAILQ